MLVTKTARAVGAADDTDAGGFLGIADDFDAVLFARRRGRTRPLLFLE